VGSIPPAGTKNFLPEAVAKAFCLRASSWRASRELPGAPKRRSRNQTLSEEISVDQMAESMREKISEK
jgi:hypothetical protein